MTSIEEFSKEEISRNARIASSVACAMNSGAGLDWGTVSTVAGIIESLWTDDEALDLKIESAKAEMSLLRAAATISDFKDIATVHFVEAFLGLVGVVRNGGFTCARLPLKDESLNGNDALFNTFITPKLEMHDDDEDEENAGESGEHSPANSSNDTAEHDDDEKPSAFSMSVVPGTIDLSGLFGSSPPLTNGVNGQHRPAKRANGGAARTPVKAEPKKRKTLNKTIGGKHGAAKDAVEIPASAMRGGPLQATGKRQWKCLLKNCSVSYDNLGGLGWHISAKHWSEGEFVACCLNCDKRLSCGRACSHAKRPQCTTANFAYWFDDILDDKQKKMLHVLENNILGDCPYEYCDSKIESLQNLYDHGRVTHRKDGRLVFMCTGCGVAMCKPSQLLKHAVRECGGARVITKIQSAIDETVNTIDED